MNQKYKSKKIKSNRFKKNKVDKQSSAGLNNFMKKYITPVKRYIILAVVLAIIARIVVTGIYGAVVAMNQIGGYDWLISVIVAGAYGLLEYKHHHKAKLHDVVMNSVILGIAFGLIIAILDWSIIHDMWSFLNILKKPLIIGLIFGAISSISFVFHKN